MHLFPEQTALLEEGVGGGRLFAMTVIALPDISIRYGPLPPEICWDPELGIPRLVTWPQIVQVDWNMMYAGDVYATSLVYEKSWRRFPSLPGQLRGVSMWEPGEVGAYEGFRIWNLWPVSESIVEAVEDAVCDWFGDFQYQSLETYTQVSCGDYDLCDFASWAGQGDVEEHDHEDEWVAPDGTTHHLNWALCRTGMTAFQDLERELLVQPTSDPDDGLAVRWFPGPRLPSPAEEAWSSLLVSSERNALRAMDAFPPWERDRMIAKEREYSPWLWLC